MSAEGKAESFRAEFTIANPRGLHARASAKLVQIAAKFDAEITVAKDGMSVSARSIMGLMMLAAAMGSSIAVEAKGREAKAAMAALGALIQGGFGEES